MNRRLWGKYGKLAGLLFDNGKTARLARANQIRLR